MQITFNVRASEHIKLDDIKPFQGELKKLSTENHNKLRTEIIEDGFNFAPHIWKYGGDNYILDGHQRIYTLKQLAKEGYEFEYASGEPLNGCVPCNIVQASDINNAKRKVLQAVSQYGKLDDEGFKDFTLDIDFDLDGFDFPDFVLPGLESTTDFPDMNEGDKEPFQQMTFTLADSQAEYIQSALKDYVPDDEACSHGNENKNGNKLYGAIKEWAEQKI